MYCVSGLRAAALGVACLAGTAVVHAQAAPGSAALSTAKIGVIDIRQAIMSTAEGKLASAELQSQFAPRQKELEALSKQINELRQRLAAGQTLRDEEKDRLTLQGQRLATQFDRKNNELNEDMQSAQAEVLNGIGRRMTDVLDHYSRENGYTAVFDSSAQILYKTSNIDLTQDIVRLYDQAYPAKAATPATKPPKPTTMPPSAKP